MHIRLATGAVTAGDPISGEVSLDRARGPWRQLVIGLIRVVTVDGTVREDARELLRLGAAQIQTEAPIGFTAATDGQPAGYSGKRLSVGHRIEAAAETAAGEWVTERADVVLRPGAGTPMVPAPPAPWTLAPLVGGCLVAAAVVLVVVSRGAVDATLAAAVNAAIGAALLMPSLRRWRSGSMQLSWTPRRPVPGGRLDVQATVGRRRPWTLTRVMMSVEAEEGVEVPEADGHSVERTAILTVRETLFEGQRRVAAGEMVTFDGTLAIPEGAPPSFRCGSGRVEWQVRVAVESDTGSREEVRSLVVDADRGGNQYISEGRS